MAAFESIPMDEQNLDELKKTFYKEVIRKRAENMKEDITVASEFVSNWRKTKPESFEFLFNCWYKDNFVKGKK